MIQAQDESGRKSCDSPVTQQERRREDSWLPATMNGKYPDVSPSLEMTTLIMPSGQKGRPAKPIRENMKVWPAH